MTPKTLHEDFSTTTGDGEPSSSVFAPTPLLLAADVDREHYNRVMAALAKNHKTRREARQAQFAMQNHNQRAHGIAETYTSTRLQAVRKEIESEAKQAILAPRFFVPSMLQDQEDMRREALMISGACALVFVAWMLWRWAGKG